jgi:hypothetical protein
LVDGDGVGVVGSVVGGVVGFEASVVMGHRSSQPHTVTGSTE